MKSSLLDQVRIFLFMLSLFVSGCSPETATGPPAPESPSAPGVTPAPTNPSPPPESPPPVIDSAPPVVDSAPPAAAAPAAPRPPSRSNRTKSVKSFAVYTLSRGTGVPPEARDVLEQVTNLVEADRKRGVKVTVQTTRIGIEGEQRLCAEYEDPREGTRAWERAGAIANGVDLVNLVAAPCASPAPVAETQK